MGTIIKLDGFELAQFLDEIENAKARGIRIMRFSIGESSVKVKVNEGIWSPPMGSVQEEY